MEPRCWNDAQGWMYTNVVWWPRRESRTGREERQVVARTLAPTTADLLGLRDWMGEPGGHACGDGEHWGVLEADLLRVGRGVHRVVRQRCST